MDVRLLVIAGLPASGKSTLAQALAVRYGAALIAKDSIKEPLLDQLGALDRAASRRLSAASFAVLFALARVQLAVGCHVLLEGNFRSPEHDLAFGELLTDSAARHGVRCAQVQCVTAEGLRRERLAARAHDPARHPGHRDAEQLAEATALEPQATGAAPSAVAAAAWLPLPGARWVHPGLDTAEWPCLLSALDRWWSGDQPLRS